MKNACRINDDGTVSILLNLKDGSTLEALVTAEDYEKYAEPFGGTWIAVKHQRTKKYYCRGGRYHNTETGLFEQPMLHRLIAKPEKGEITVHINHNTLDCTPENMINIPIGADVAEYLTKSVAVAAAQPVMEKYEPVYKVDYLQPVGEDLQPVKGVSLHKVKDKWEASPFYEGTRYRLGYWSRDQLAAANAAVTELREIGPEAYFEKHPKKGRK